MKKNNIVFDRNSSTYADLTPSQCVKRMFECTNERGKLYMPELPGGEFDDETGKICVCKMAWDCYACESVIKAHSALCDSLKKIAEKSDVNNISSEYNKDALTGGLLEIWNNYVRDFKTDNSGVIELFEKADSELTENEKNTLSEYKRAVTCEAEERIGKGVAAYDTLMRAKRLCILMSLSAPEYVINRESKLLAQAMALHRYCIDMGCI